LNVVTGESAVFWIQEVEDEKHEIYFGDGVVGKKLQNGNVISVEYMTTNGEDANGVKTFTATGPIDSLTNFTIETVSVAQNGIALESNDSVKFLAPLYYETQNRAVNKHDYEVLIKKDYPQIEFIRVWGGEENDPPVYGKVFIAAKPFGALAFSNQEKETILNTIVRPRNPVSIEAVIVEPDYLQILIISEVLYSSKETSLTAGEIQVKIENDNKAYRDENLVGFDKKLRYSKIVEVINNADESIVSNLTSLKLKYTITPALNVTSSYQINLNTPVDKGDANNNVSALNTTAFLKDGLVSYIGDDGKGNLYIYRLVSGVKVITENNIGTLDYTNGQIIIPSLLVQQVIDEDDIHFFVDPAKLDIIPVRNQVLVINDFDISISVSAEDA
jgi:hypothetical protein